MKYFIVILTVGIFFLGIFFYFLNNTSPFQIELLQEKVNEAGIRKDDWESFNSFLESSIENGTIQNYLTGDIILVYLSLCVGASFVFSALHLGLDKLFFKKFYESPSKIDAIRRGILFGVAIGITLYLRFIRTDISVVLLSFLSLLLFELLLGKAIKSLIINLEVRVKTAYMKSKRSS